MVKLLGALRAGMLMSSLAGDEVVEEGAGGGAAPVVAEPVAAPVVADPAVVVAPVEPVVPPAAPVAAVPELPDPHAWKMAEITKLRAKVAELRQAKTPAAGAAPDPANQAEFEAAVSAEAARRATKAAWDSQMNSIAKAGRDQFGVEEFNARLKVVRELVDPSDEVEVQNYNIMLSAAAETGHAAALLHELGSDPAKLQAVLSESPLKMAVTLAAMAGKLVAPKELSAAPKPIKPIGSQGIHYEGIKPDDPDRGTQLPIAEWMKQREAQVKERGLQ